ncbi:MAG TPA: hypothetical protein VHM91_06130 [Verrucomicrobiales bacterium]|jgi:hypothetical protein|nr:hypothetical protein [Verrucomicrobiales bacterium]
MNTTAEILLSRNFVEFGPFTRDELSVFATRGILLDGDFVKENGGEAWLPCTEWVAALTAPKAAEPPKKAPAKKKAAKPKA